MSLFCLPRYLKNKPLFTVALVTDGSEEVEDHIISQRHNADGQFYLFIYFFEKELCSFTIKAFIAPYDEHTFFFLILTRWLLRLYLVKFRLYRRIIWKQTQIDTRGQCCLKKKKSPCRNLQQMKWLHCNEAETEACSYFWISTKSSISNQVEEYCVNLKLIKFKNTRSLLLHYCYSTVLIYNQDIASTQKIHFTLQQLGLLSLNKSFLLSQGKYNLWTVQLISWSF